MSNDTNRTIIVLFLGIWIILMAVVIFLTWAAGQDAVERLRDFVRYLDDHRDSAGKLIVTLSALVLVVLALLLIILELGPEEETRELRVQQAGATTIVPAEALRRRLEEALVSLPDITAAKARVSTRDKGLITALDVTVTPRANVAFVTQEATRVVVDTIQTDLGLPVLGVPKVRIAFGPAKAEPVASSVSQPPLPPTPLAVEREPELREVETVDERVEVAPEGAGSAAGAAGESETAAAELMGSVAEAPPAEPPVMDPLEGSAAETEERPQP